MSWRKRLRRWGEAARAEQLLPTDGLEIRALPCIGDSAVVAFGSLAENLPKDVLQHSVAPVMNQKGRLRRIVDLALTDGAPALTTLLAQNFGCPRQPGETFETNPDDWYRENGPGAAGSAVPQQGEPT